MDIVDLATVYNLLSSYECDCTNMPAYLHVFWCLPAQSSFIFLAVVGVKGIDKRDWWLGERAKLTHGYQCGNSSCTRTKCVKQCSAAPTACWQTEEKTD